MKQVANTLYTVICKPCRRRNTRLANAAYSYPLAFINNDMQKAILILLLSLTNILTFANGGPIDVSNFYRTHNIQLIDKADIEIISEDLFVKIEGKYSIVTVVYKIKNLGIKQNLKYGFAIDYFDNSESLDSESKDFESIKSFAFYDNEKQLFDTSTIYENNIEQINSTIDYYRIYNPISINRKWFITDLYFDKEEIKTLKVEYKVSNQHVDHVNGFSFIPTFSERVFTYYFLPSSRFGNGRIKDFTIKIDISELLVNNSKYKVSGISQFVKNGDILTFTQSNFDLKKQQRLIINYDNSDFLLSNMINKHLIPNSEIVSITCSNKSNPYNLIDNNPLTAWKGKRNDWIELTFKVDTINNTFKDYGICAIQILNGDYSNQNNFTNSAKIKKIRIFINDTAAYRPINGEYGDSVMLGKPKYISFDNKYLKAETQTIAEGFSVYRYYSEIFGDRIKNNHTKKTIKKIKIQVQDLYLGNQKFKEFVIPEIYFIGAEKD